MPARHSKSMLRRLVAAAHSADEARGFAHFRPSDVQFDELGRAGHSVLILRERKARETGLVYSPEYMLSAAQVEGLANGARAIFRLPTD